MGWAGECSGLLSFCRAVLQHYRAGQVVVCCQGAIGHCDKRHGALQPFKHPATFATLALPDKLREQVLGKLHSFKQDADFYSRTGRAHKMGMLLHGPPGTGGLLLVPFPAAAVSQPQPVVEDAE